MISTVLPHHILEVGLPVAEEVDEHGLLHGGERDLDRGPGEVAGVVRHGGPLHLLARPEKLVYLSSAQLVYRCTELVMSHLYNLCTDVQNWLCITSTACVQKDITGYVSPIQLVYLCTELVMYHLYS